MTHIALVLPYYTADVATLPAMLARYALLRHLPLALVARGYRVTVFLLATDDADLHQDGVHYRAVRSQRPAVWLGRGLQRLKPTLGPAYWEPAQRLAAALRAARPDVVHVFGLTLDINLALLTRAAEQIDAPVIVHFHGGVPSAGARIRRLQQRNLARVRRVLFTHTEQARPWLESGLLAETQVGQALETSVALTPLPPDVARAQTGMHGDPVCLSVGRLHPIKDPLTTLHGFAQAAARLPEARLYLYYLTDELLSQLQAALANYPAEIAARVEFRGRARPEEMPALYSSADLLLQASRREWSSLAVLEALACGCIPVVSDIPALQTLTAGGRYGRLFPVGDAAALSAALVALDPATRAALSTDARAHFTRDLSFAALAARLDAEYTRVLP